MVRETAKDYARGRRGEDAHKLLENVTFVTFNYDRCLEFFLINALTKVYGDQNLARGIVTSARIIHVYGTVGALPALTGSENSEEGRIGFGGGPGAGPAIDRYLHFPSLVGRIKTYTEQIKDKAHLDGVQWDIERCEQLFFLGFGYHQPNIDLLQTDGKNGASRIFGSMFGMPAASVPFVRGRMGKLLRDSVRSHLPYAIDLNRELTCAAMIDEFREPLIG